VRWQLSDFGQFLDFYIVRRARQLIYLPEAQFCLVFANQDGALAAML